jgi:ribonuclease HI
MMMYLILAFAQKSQ